MHACFRENPGSSARALQLVSACCLRVQAFGANSQLCKDFMDRKPLDNTFFFSVFKPKHNLATVRTLLILHTRDAYACLGQRAHN